MTHKKTSPKATGAVTEGSGKGRSGKDRGPSNQSARPVSSKSEAIIKEVSVRRRAAIKVLADR